MISQINQSHQIIFFIIFQIQVTDTIKITTQKQGGLANNNRAIAVVRIFTKINITIVRKTILIILKKNTFKLLYSLTITMRFKTVTIEKANTIIVIITDAK